MFGSTFLKGNSLNDYALFQFLLRLKQVANEVGAGLKNVSRLSIVNSLVCLSGSTIPIGMGAEAEFPCGGLAVVRGTVCGKSWSGIICVWQVHDESVIICASSWFIEDIWFPRAAQWCGPAQWGIFDRGRVANTSLLLPHWSYSDWHPHCLVLLFLKGCPKQQSVMYRTTMVWC